MSEITVEQLFAAARRLTADLECDPDYAPILTADAAQADQSGGAT